MWKHIKKAVKISYNSGYRHKLGAILLDKKGNVISKGYNINKTHPMQARYAPKEKQFLHAEIAALVKARKQAHTIVVARERKDGSLGLAKPCDICMEAIKEAGIKCIVYTIDNSTYATERL